MLNIIFFGRFRMGSSSHLHHFLGTGEEAVAKATVECRDEAEIFRK